MAARQGGHEKKVAEWMTTGDKESDVQVTTEVHGPQGSQNPAFLLSFNRVPALPPVKNSLGRQQRVKRRGILCQFSANKL